MRLVSFGPRGQEKPGVVNGDRVIDLLAANPSIPPSVRQILEVNALARIATVVKKADTLPAKCFHELAAVRLGPPVTMPSKIVCVGLNYRDHAREQGKEVPDWPLTFAKASTALVGLNETVELPAGVTQLDHEVELAIVIGRPARKVELENARDYIAGYSVFMDISARDIQYREKQFFRAKSFDGFGPMGPYLVTADEVPNPHELDIHLKVNGTVYQSSNTREMTFDCNYLVHHLSHTMTLLPGDVIATGTPAGVGVFASPQRFLRVNDVLEATVESLGTLVNRIV